MREFVNYLLFGWYPYLAVTVMFFGSILRFDRAQYSWRSESSQFLRRRQMLIGSNLFHLGILVILVGHFVGLLTPIAIFETFGISHTAKQVMAITVGGIAGIAALIGCSLLLHRRLFDPRIRRNSSIGDILVLSLIWLQLAVGIASFYWTFQALDGREMVRFMGWAQGLLTFRPDAAGLLQETALVYRFHIVIGLTIFLITPFTRLVHVFSAPVWYLFRPGYQIVRARGGRHAVRNTAAGATSGAASIARAHAESAQ
ncbi:MAG TPA: respiratory nitrate reductase subunit gamma [Geminicoccus sp.]|uniref:respiratory nitrate reductase subunit gamma n=1 Tax=Geminicoccus sp. TaxID=2024832 RepID=UPI002CAF4A6A|nr:respiratory nitrate reductase subunit gamma [Geminicoccus sp.]HWL69999.1 respiratory nitrate reductase subunit gamma [Geminicoccus sp.]